MLKYILLVFAALLGLLTFTANGEAIQVDSILPACDVDQFMTPAGCWSSCSASKYDTCPDVFPALYNPSFCAYTKDGRYISFTYQCQACKSTEVVAVRSGACDCSIIQCGFAQRCLNGQCVNIPFDPINLCLNVKCPPNFVCQNGKCVQKVRQCPTPCLLGYICRNGLCIPDFTIDKCLLASCQPGYTCIKGQCIKNSACLPTEYETPSGCWKSCKSDQFSTCKDSIFITIYDPKFCAYTVDGKYLNYTFACQACQNTQVLAVRDGVCNCSFIKCGPKQQCLNGECVNLVPIDPVDPCWTIKCGFGTVCQNGQCVKPCPTKCPPGSSCINGVCVPDSPPNACLWIKCAPGYVCFEGRCVPDFDINCALLNCKPGYTCLKGKCVPISFDLCLDVICPKGSVCRFGVCTPQIIPIDLCLLSNCPVGTICQNGKCIPIDRCQTISCRPGYYCFNGNCYPSYALCNNIACLPGFYCLNGKCVKQIIDPCATVKCSAGYICQNGKCVKDVELCQAKKIQCTLPRPNEKTCPIFYYIVAPTPLFCGITSTGQQLGFAEECSACKNKQVQYYWNKPCHEIQPCENDRICKTDFQCPKGFTCQSNKCVDRCIMMKCTAGTYCYRGSCLPLVVTEVSQVLTPLSSPLPDSTLSVDISGWPSLESLPVEIVPTVETVLIEDLCKDLVCGLQQICVAGLCVPPK